MGHNSAANAIAQMIGCQLPDAHVYVEDVFASTFNTNKYAFFFRTTVEQGKIFYNYVYRHTEDSNKKKRLPFQKLMVQNIGKLIKKTDADIIISTLWVCSKLVSEYKRSTDCQIPLITCITDISSHSVWLNPRTDFYMTATPDVKGELIDKGVDAGSIIVSGVPVRNEFKTKNVARETCKEKRLLIMGGGLGLLPKSKSFYEELDQLDGVKTTIITGKNAALYNLLSSSSYNNIEVLALVNNVPNYMKNADALLSKPGGITIFEAISAELPMMMFKPFLEQEIKNGEFMLDNNFGIVLPADQQELMAKIQEVLWDDEMLKKLRANMHEFKSKLDEDALFRLIQQFEKKSA